MLFMVSAVSHRAVYNIIRLVLGITLNMFGILPVFRAYHWHTLLDKTQELA